MRTPRSAPSSIAAAVAVAAVLALPAAADSLWDESVDGDLSNDGLTPTSLVFALGTNSITATSVQGDREYVTFFLPVGFTLDAIMLASYLSDDEVSFIAVQEGSTLTEPPTGTNVANLLGWAHFGTDQDGQDLLDDIAAGPGAIGFTPPLEGGVNYTFWIQQTGVAPATFQLDFIVTPAPAGLALLAMGGWMARRRRS